MSSSKQYDTKDQSSRREEAFQLIRDLEKKNWKGEVIVMLDGQKVSKIKKGEYV